MLEKSLDPYLDPKNEDKLSFYKFKSDLVDYFSVTKSFLDNLIEGIENDLTWNEHSNQILNQQLIFIHMDNSRRQKKAKN